MAYTKEYLNPRLGMQMGIQSLPYRKLFHAHTASLKLLSTDPSPIALASLD